MVGQDLEKSNSGVRQGLWPRFTLGGRVTSVVVIIALVIAGVIYGPNLFINKVTLHVAVLDKFDGAFSDGCQLSTYVQDKVPTRVNLVAAGNHVGGTAVSLVYVPDASGNCAGTASVTLQKGKSYEVLAFGKVVGQLTESQVAEGEGQVTIPVEVKHDINVRFDLSAHADTCTGPLSDWSCSWNNDYAFALNLNSKAGTCKGQNGYSDIQDAANVVIKGLSNHLKFTYSLVYDTYDLQSVKSKKIVCNFYAVVVGIPHDPQGYSIQVGKGHGVVDFRTADLESNGWEADLGIDS